LVARRHSQNYAEKIKLGRLAHATPNELAPNPSGTTRHNPELGIKKVPLTLMSKISSKSFSVVSAMGANLATPAFANRMSIFPQAFRTFVKRASRSSGFEMSERTASVSSPISLTAASRVL
jgi:hypothetical protein